jgi:hypothetical protein
MVFVNSMTRDVNGRPVSATRMAATRAVLLRVIGAVLGGYGVSAAVVALMAAGMARLGLARSEAVVSAALLGFVLYLLVLLWAFGVRSLWRLWSGMVVGTALASGLTWLLAQGTKV